MNQTEKPTKRIVSKAEYAALRSKRAALFLSGVVLTIAIWSGMICGVVICLGYVLIGIALLFFVGEIDLLYILSGLGIGYLLIRVGTALGDRGVNMIERADNMELPPPFTKANAGDLSPSDSLVRASSEPTQEQESVLLRASIQGQQEFADQLLRSVKE